MKRLILFLIIFTSTALADPIFVREYGSTDAVYFSLRDQTDVTALIAGATDTAANDCDYSCDGAATSACGGTLTSEGLGLYSYAPLAAETQGKVCSFIFTDADATAFAERIVHITTTSDSSAQYPDKTFDANVVSASVSGLQDFATVDTTESTCVAGSVCALSQGAANPATIWTYDISSISTAGQAGKKLNDASTGGGGSSRPTSPGSSD